METTTDSIEEAWSLAEAEARIAGWIDQGMSLLPNLVVALLVLVLFFIAAGFVQGFIRSKARRSGRDNLGEILGGFGRAATVVLGALVAATIVFPSLKPGDLVSGLGISSVAIGFAFKDILQNWLAGVLILLRQPFEIGDTIVVAGQEGCVERIESRATLMVTEEGDVAVVPNSTIYTNTVVVKSAESEA